MPVFSKIASEPATKAGASSGEKANDAPAPDDPASKPAFVTKALAAMKEEFAFTRWEAKKFDEIIRCTEQGLLGGGTPCKESRVPAMRYLPGNFCESCGLAFLMCKGSSLGFCRHPHRGYDAPADYGGPHRSIFHVIEQVRCLMVFVAGACLNDGKPTSQAGYGVSFGGEPCKYNVSAPLALDHGDTPTLQKAELQALICAMKKVESMLGTNLSLKRPECHDYCKACGKYHLRLVFCLHSKWLRSCLTEYSLSWTVDLETGLFVKKDGKTPVPNAEYLKEIETLYKRFNSKGIEVMYYLITRSENAIADRLAKEAAQKAVERAANFAQQRLANQLTSS